MDFLKIVELLAVAVPRVVAAYNRLKAENPNLSDDEAVELLRADSQRIADQSADWLAAHPRT